MNAPWESLFLRFPLEETLKEKSSLSSYAQQAFACWRKEVRFPRTNQQGSLRAGKKQSQQLLLLINISRE
jgi:hypothetical protein